MIEGTQLTKAEAGIPQNQVQWVVNLTFDSDARKTFANVTRQIANADQRAHRPAEAVRDRPRRQGASRAPTVNGVDPQRPGRDQRRLHPGVRARRWPTA